MLRKAAWRSWIRNFPVFDCRESGSERIRFLIPVAMALKDETVFAGSGKLPQRPLSPLKEEMERHGCKFEMLTGIGTRSCKAFSECYRYGKYRLLWQYRRSDFGARDHFENLPDPGAVLQPGEYRLAGNISSQFITGTVVRPAAS